MSTFYIILGLIGLFFSSVGFIINYVDNKSLVLSSIIWGFFFTLSTIGFYLDDKKPSEPKPTAQELAIQEYNSCLSRYDRGIILKIFKRTEEQMCSNLNLEYKRKVLGNVKAK